MAAGRNAEKKRLFEISHGGWQRARSFCGSCPLFLSRRGFRSYRGEGDETENRFSHPRLNGNWQRMDYPPDLQGAT